MNHAPPARDGNIDERGKIPQALSYVQAYRDRQQVWRTILAMVAGLGALLAVLFVAAVPVGTALDRLLGVTPFDPAAPSFTVGFWIAGNLLLAALIPTAGLLQWSIYRQKPRWLSSLAGGFRWRVLGRAAVIIVPLWAAYMVVLQFVMPTGPIQLTATTIALSAVAVITVPLQSAGEEYLFRGLLSRAIGARFRRPAAAFTVATAVTALLFGAIHGAANGWTLAYYIICGVALSVVVQRTGGLEVAVLVHAVNNTMLLVPTILADRLGTLSAPTGPVLIIPMAVIALAAAIMWRLAPRIISPN
ncbi:lysostaphin resistance A-like protein [Saccharopolyspora sp. 5N102]|uniref:lysostaphin resistance A-like protein n=1 Tax=Saccharopolyspora sp. 5N102 TaxID=3375155 RepID=UPI0037A66E84